jgi:hypothetical protein
MDGNREKKKEKFICCFCTNQIEENDFELEIRPILNTKEIQIIYCHKKCLDAHMDKKIPRHPELLE